MASAESKNIFRLREYRQTKNSKCYQTGDFLPKTFVAIHSFPLSKQKQKQFKKNKNGKNANNLLYTVDINISFKLRFYS